MFAHGSSKERIVQLTGAVVAILIGLTTAFAEESVMTDEEELWAIELSIYEARGKGDLNLYQSYAHDDYLGWPPQFPAPLSLGSFRDNSKVIIPEEGERVEITKKEIQVIGDTALVYYLANRTQMAGGEKVNQFFDNIHVWMKVDGKWRLAGGMARPMPPESRQAD